MEMKQNQTFFHGTYSNLTPYHHIFFIKKYQSISVTSKSKFLGFMFEVNPNNGNETKSGIVSWDIFKYDTISFFVKKY